MLQFFCEIRHNLNIITRFTYIIHLIRSDQREVETIYSWKQNPTMLARRVGASLPVQSTFIKYFIGNGNRTMQTSVHFAQQNARAIQGDLLELDTSSKRNFRPAEGLFLGLPCTHCRVWQVHTRDFFPETSLHTQERA